MADNGTKAQEKKIEDLSIQQRTEQQANLAGVASLWFRSSVDVATEIWPWWAEQRDRDLRLFVQKSGNDILQGAMSSMVKKFKSMNWVIEAPERVANRYQDLLANSEFGRGWTFLLSKVLYDYLSQDKGAFIELVGAGNPDGAMKGPVLGLAHLDSGLCQLTGDIEFPVLFLNAKSEAVHKLHATRVIHIVDLPNPREDMVDVGFCAVSRVVSSSQVLLKLAKYKNEKLSDLPPAALALFNNILPQQFDDAQADFHMERRRMGQELWANVMALFSLDPTQPATVDFIDFASLPDAYDELTSTNIYINILALSFGVDVREFWPLSAGALGTAAETLIQHQKARGKGVGDIISTLERALNWQVLPKTAHFRFDFQDDEEDEQRARIIKMETDTIMSMWQPPRLNAQFEAGVKAPISAMEIRQMLADNIPYFNEDFLAVDISDEVEASDTDQIEKAYGRMVQIDRYGEKQYSRRSKEHIDDVLSTVEKNYKEGLIDLETVMDFRLGQMADERITDENPIS